jgi:hypothetical protein
MFLVVAALCSTAFTLGGMTAGSRQDASGIPPQHPVQLALRYQKELGLSSEQVASVNQLRDALAKEFAPFRVQAESIQHQMQELQQSGQLDADAAGKLQKDGEELGAKMKPMFERYAKSLGDLLSDEQRQKLMKLSQATSHDSDESDFPLMVIMQSRDQLGITPQQFTKLQYLQADFIRAFAPIREQVELLQMDMQEKFGKAGTQPTPDYIERGQKLKGSVTELKTQFSNRAISDVLLPNQKAKLEELLHGEHRSAPSGG